MFTARQNTAGAPEQDAARVDDFTAWCTLPAAELTTVEEVEIHVLKPLLDFAVGEVPQVEVRSGGDVGSHVVYLSDRPMCAVTVAARVRRGRDWTDCPAFREAVAYANSLGVSAMLVDSLDVYLIDYGADRPRKILPRSMFTRSALAVVHDHLLVGESV